MAANTVDAARATLCPNSQRGRAAGVRPAGPFPSSCSRQHVPEILEFPRLLGPKTRHMEPPDRPISHAPKVRVEFHVVAEINGKEKSPGD